MAWREELAPVRMQRVALVAPAQDLRGLLVAVAELGVVEVQGHGGGEGGADQGEAGRLLRRLRAEPAPLPRLAEEAPDLDALVARGRLDLVAGEAELEGYAAAAVTRDGVAALAGWTPAAEVDRLAARVAPLGAGVVPLPSPRGVDAPTLLRPESGLRETFAPLVRTYATVPYADVDPTVLAGLAYVLMFGVMFGDAGHGALLVGAGLLLRSGRVSRLARFRELWLFVVGAGLASVVAGLLYGEFFGPTGVVPVLWLAPLEEPVTLMAAGVGMGAVLLSGAYVLGTVNRWREGRWPLALIAPSGIAGVALFAGLGLVVLGAVAGVAWAVVLGALVAAGGLVLAYLGFLAAAGGGAAGVAQATVELIDSVIRLATNLVSFARLAAFGLTHAALGLLVWQATTALGDRGGPWIVVAALAFAGGNAVAFALEGLVAGIQALRLEYYELFSRVFTGEGRPFAPWRLPVDHDRPALAGTAVPGGTTASERNL